MPPVPVVHWLEKLDQLVLQVPARHMPVEDTLPATSRSWLGFVIPIPILPEVATINGAFVKSKVVPIPNCPLGFKPAYILYVPLLYWMLAFATVDLVILIRLAFAPYTSKLVDGLVAPMPTLPDVATVR